jgi:transposase
MAGRRKDVFDIREMVRRFRLGERDRRIGRDLATSRNTVAKYRAWAQREGFLGGEDLPGPGVIEKRLAETGSPDPEKPGPESLVEAHRAFVVEKRAAGVEVTALFALLRERDFTGSYTTLLRFVRKLEKKEPDKFLRIEVAPGEEAQVDFGYAGLQFDPLTRTQRRAWVFVMTLSFSRHQYAEIVFDQRVETFVALHVRAFEWFGGVPRRIVIDNLKAGITRAVLHDSEAQRSYREAAEHYGFLIAPCRPRTPRHKGKVESGVRYVNRNALAGRSFPSVVEANAWLRTWALETAGLRDHGTTHEAPLTRFAVEREVLGALPPRRFEVVVWKRVKLHPDCYVVFEASFYSAPHRFVEKILWLRATAASIEIYADHERVATHPRAVRRGERMTIDDHLPPEKLLGLLPAPKAVRDAAEKVGPKTAEFVETLLGDRPVDRIRGAQGVVRLAKRHGEKRLEAACRRALAFGEVRYRTVKTILEKALDLDDDVSGSFAAPAPLPRTSTFARTAAELLPSSTPTTTAIAN